MKNGSRKSSATPMAPEGATDVAKVKMVKHREAPTGPHLAALAPIPEEAMDAPVEWAEKHIESLAPASAKELEWALKFGSDQARREVARDLLAMKGITTKPKDTAQVQQAVVINMGLPVTPSGAPVLPFSNAAPVLDSAASAVTDDKRAPVHGGRK